MLYVEVKDVVKLMCSTFLASYCSTRNTSALYKHQRQLKASDMRNRARNRAPVRTTIILRLITAVVIQMFRVL